MSPAWNVGERLADRFVVRSFDGEGPLGERYLAHDDRSGVDVALRAVHARLIPDEEARRFFRERMARARSMAHTNLLKIYSVFTHEGREVIAVQHAPGQSLAELASSRDVFAWNEARPILGQVAAAMAHANHLGMVLGDVRPSTVVMVGESVKVTSVGVALALPRELYLGAVATHPEYPHLSPELRLGGYCDGRADVYSLAALAMVLLSGSELESARAGMRPDLPSGLIAAIERGLDEDPGRRQPNVEALLAALDRSADAARPRTGPVTLPASITSPRLAAATPPPVSSQPYDEPSSIPPDVTRSREMTRQVDSEELRRLAGEVSDLLETTRQVDLNETTRQVDVNELDSLRARSRGTESVPMPTRTREPSQRVPIARESSGPHRDTARIPPMRDNSGMGRLPSRERPTRPAQPDSDDLEFDLVPDSGAPAAKVAPQDAATPRPSRITAPSLVPTSAALRPPGDDETDFSSIRLTPAAVPAVAPSDSLPPRSPMLDLRSDEPVIELRGTALTPDTSHDAVAFHAPHDPFAAALEAAHDVLPATPSSGVPAESLHDDDDEGPALIIVGDRPSRGPHAPTMERPIFEEQHAAELAPPAAAVAPDLAPAPELAPASESQLAVESQPPVAAPKRPSGAVPVVSPASQPARRPSGQRPVVAARQSSSQQALFWIGVGLLVIALAAAAFLLGRSVPSSPANSVAPTPVGTPSATVTTPLPSVSPLPVSPTRATPVEPPAPTPISPTVVPTTPPTTATPPPVAPTEPPANPTTPTTPATTPAPPTPEMLTVAQHGKSYLIDAYEFPGKGSLPRVDVSLDEARQLCTARGARLCTVKEWEMACRGEGGASYPYGAKYDASVCNTADGKLEATGAFVDCRSGVGAFDMSGNAAEWTDHGAIKGGAFGEGNPGARCSHDGHGDGKPSPTIGFRCCKDQ